MAKSAKTLAASVAPVATAPVAGSQDEINNAVVDLFTNYRTAERAKELLDNDVIKAGQAKASAEELLFVNLASAAFKGSWPEPACKVAIEAAIVKHYGNRASDTKDTTINILKSRCIAVTRVLVRRDVPAMMECCKQEFANNEENAKKFAARPIQAFLKLVTHASETFKDGANKGNAINKPITTTAALQVYARKHPKGTPAPRASATPATPAPTGDAWSQASAMIAELAKQFPAQEAHFAKIAAELKAANEAEKSAAEPATGAAELDDALSEDAPLTLAALAKMGLKLVAA